VKEATNKRRCFEVLSAAGVPVPRFATGKETVTWSGTTVVRHKLTGHSGEGIEIVEKKEDLPNAPLYVEYIKKQDEYRIHVGRKGDVYSCISEQRKARSLDVPLERVNWKVRNHNNGFVFVREDCNPPDSVRIAAVEAIKATGLDFGAVDVIYNAKEDRAYVLEINTAPGLEGQTIEDYRSFFNQLT
jgi:glutathione synthase/RimK-type ligase-like ATP-grasp enzyme